jgi:hypothetical protein
VHSHPNSKCKWSIQMKRWPGFSSGYTINFPMKQSSWHKRTDVFQCQNLTFNASYDKVVNNTRTTTIPNCSSKEEHLSSTELPICFIDAFAQRSIPIGIVNILAQQSSGSSSAGGRTVQSSTVLSTMHGSSLLRAFHLELSPAFLS